MEDAFLVGVLDGLADIDKESQAIWEGELALFAIDGDGQAMDQLHDEVRATRGGGAGVIDGSDPRVIHESQRLAFDIEASDDLEGIHADLDDFEGDLAADGGGLFGPPDEAEATFSQFLAEGIGADVLAGLIGVGGQIGREKVVIKGVIAGCHGHAEKPRPFSDGHGLGFGSGWGAGLI